jgi:hypothetical protein
MTYNDRCPPRYEVFKLPTSPIIRAKDFSQAHPHYSLPVNPLLNQQSCLTLNKPAQTLQTVKWLSRALRRILYAEYAEDPFRLGRAITVISMNAAAKHRQIANTAAFKFAKDLKRHLGSGKASSSCNKLFSSSTGFACVCNKSYTRKDSLMRHLRALSTEGHRCKACNKSPCQCS